MTDLSRCAPPGFLRRRALLAWLALPLPLLARPPEDPLPPTPQLARTYRSGLHLPDWLVSEKYDSLDRKSVV